MASYKTFLLLAIVSTIFVSVLADECGKCIKKDAEAMTNVMTKCAKRGDCNNCSDKGDDCLACMGNKTEIYVTDNLKCWDKDYKTRNLNEQEQSADMQKKILESQECLSVFMQCCRGECTKPQ